MNFYARPTVGSWFLFPTVGYIEYDDGERAIAMIWLQLEVGVSWWSG